VNGSHLSLYLIPINMKTSRVVYMRRQAKRQAGPYSAILSESQGESSRVRAFRILQPHSKYVSVGSRICLVNLQKAELNGLLGDIVSVGGESVGVELEQNDQRIAVRPHNLEPGLRFVIQNFGGPIPWPTMNQGRAGEVVVCRLS
jgi:hypothetical protein